MYKMASAQTSFPLQDLCARALSSPSSITPSERALILGSPDPATENDLYIAATSLPLPALVAKALASPPTLSPQEAHVLAHGPVQRSRAEKAARLQAYQSLTPEQRSFLDRASEAVADKEEKRARNVAYRLLQSAKAEIGEQNRSTTAAGISSAHGQQQPEAASQPGEAPSNYRRPTIFPWERADWITLIREKNFSSWGLVVLRTAYNDPASWLSFKSRFSSLAVRELTRIAPKPITDTFSVKYIDDEDSLAGARQAKLLACYAQLVREGELGEEYQWGIFISVDENVLERFGMEEREWVVPVWEVEWRVGELGELREQVSPGALAMEAGLVFAVLVPKVVRGDERPLEALRMIAGDR